MNDGKRADQRKCERALWKNPVLIVHKKEERKPCFVVLPMAVNDTVTLRVTSKFLLCKFSYLNTKPKVVKEEGC